MPRRALRNIALLAICQALTQSSNTLMFASSALAVLTIVARLRMWANLPVTMQHLGVMLSVFPGLDADDAPRPQVGFRTGSLFGMAGASCAAIGLGLASFPLLCVGGLVLGYAVANMQLYRFAAVELAPGKFRAQAISYVTAGGVIAGIVGPGLARLTPDLWLPTFQASFAAVIVIHALVFMVLGFIEFPVVRPEDASGPQRPLIQIVTQPAYMVAAAGAMIAFRRDVVRHGGLAARHRAVRARQERSAGHHFRACHGHVHPGLFHRQPDRPLRRVQHDDSRHCAADRWASRSRCSAHRGTSAARWAERRRLELPVRRRHHLLTTDLPAPERGKAQASTTSWCSAPRDREPDGLVCSK
jgi:hypothetical protein